LIGCAPADSAQKAMAIGKKSDQRCMLFIRAPQFRPATPWERRASLEVRIIAVASRAGEAKGFVAAQADRFYANARDSRLRPRRAGKMSSFPDSAGDDVAGGACCKASLMLKLAFGLNFPDLYATAGLAKVDAAFLAFLCKADAVLSERLAAARANKAMLDRGQESALLIAIAPHLEDFVALLFASKPEVAALQRAQHRAGPALRCKRQSCSARR